LKEQAVLRLLKGEDMELISRQMGFAMHELAQWREKFILGGREGLKSHPRDPLNAELEQRDKLISKLALENEILKKARAIAVSRKP
jgi:transposase-like protein